MRPKSRCSKKSTNDWRWMGGKGKREEVRLGTTDNRTNRGAENEQLEGVSNSIRILPFIPLNYINYINYTISLSLSVTQGGNKKTLENR